MSPPPNVNNVNAIINGTINNNSESTNGNGNIAAASNITNVPSYPKNLDEWLNNNNNNVNTSVYQQKSLDDWLNATMKDSPKTFSVSSTEFLDGPKVSVPQFPMNGIGPQAGSSHHYRLPDSTVNIKIIFD